MAVESIILDGFRNYSREEIRFSPGVNLLTGENAQGKTNLLEGVWRLSGMKSPRARADRDLIQFGRDDASLSAQISARNRTFRVEIRLFRNGRRQMAVNGAAVRNAADLRALLRAVFFRPEDLALVRDGPAVRRQFLDAALVRLRPRYAAALAAYRDALNAKTRLLRAADALPGLLPALPAFGEQLVRHGAALVRYRARYLRRLQEFAAKRHEECSNGREILTLRYQTVADVTDPEAPESVVAGQLRAHMDAHSRAELAARQCLSGPHRDDFAVEINGREARAWSSQGQTRTAALALKLAEWEILRNASGESPVLLLDDALSELDPFRQSYLLRRVDGAQLLLTCCDAERLVRLPDVRTFLVREGRVRPVEAP